MKSRSTRGAVTTPCRRCERPPDFRAPHRARSVLAPARRRRPWHEPRPPSGRHRAGPRSRQAPRAARNRHPCCRDFRPRSRRGRFRLSRATRESRLRPTRDRCGRSRTPRPGRPARPHGCWREREHRAPADRPVAAVLSERKNWPRIRRRRTARFLRRRSGRPRLRGFRALRSFRAKVASRRLQSVCRHRAQPRLPSSCAARSPARDNRSMKNRSPREA
jgi:hypothetical protein